MMSLYISCEARASGYSITGAGAISMLTTMCPTWATAIPQVVEALHRQAAALNIHTRYLHYDVVHYAERLTSSRGSRGSFDRNSGPATRPMAGAVNELASLGKTAGIPGTMIAPAARAVVREAPS